MIDVTKELRVEEFSSDEFNTLLGEALGSYSCRIENHQVIYGEGELVLTFKSRSRRIRKVEVKDKKSTFYRLVKEMVDQVSVKGKRKIVSRVVFTLGPVSMKPIRWMDRWQIGEAPEDCPRPEVMSGDFPLLLQYEVFETGVHLFDSERRKRQFREAFLPLVPMAAIFMKPPGIFDYTLLYDPNGNRVSHSWALIEQAEKRSFWNCLFRSAGKTSLQNLWVQRDYLLRGKLSYEQFYGNESEARLWSSFPALEKATQNPKEHEWQLMLAFLEMLRENSKDDYEIFLKACHWYHKAVCAEGSTERLLFFVIMIEMFLDNESERCDKCDSQLFGISQKFREFIKARLTDWLIAEEEAEKWAKKLYGLRSKIAHEGVSLMAEDMGFGSGWVPSDWDEMHFMRPLSRICAVILLSWLQQKAHELMDQPA